MLNRLTYGPRPGDVEKVLDLGVWGWLDWQLEQEDPGPATRGALARLPRLVAGPRQLEARYPHHSQVVADAIAAGALDRGDYLGEGSEASRQRALEDLASYARSQGVRPLSDLLAEVRGQRLYRALLSDSQLHEVLTDFWFNHFNVSALHGETRSHVLAYERDAIRPRVLGRFEDLLGAVARHPAMLLYLGNARSVSPAATRTRFDLAMAELGDFSPTGNAELGPRLARALDWRAPEARRRTPGTAGINENYARELLELHTLGVDGGYGQRDVREVARAFTGWGVVPKGRPGARLRNLLGEVASQGKDWGFELEGDFVFRADRHDAEPKTVLGHDLSPGRGIEDGLEVLTLVARHPATARHLAHKLAVRFVDDDPPPALVRRLERTWRSTDGDLREMVRALVASPEFWASGVRPRKLKSPFELVVSALRILEARVDDPQPLVAWIARAGEAPYTYAAPTGYGDDRETWLDVGALLVRANFAFALVRERIPGVWVDLESLIEPDVVLDFPEDALAALQPRLLPGRDPGEALEELMIWSDPLDKTAVAQEAPVVLPRPPDGGRSATGPRSQDEAAGPPSDEGVGHRPVAEIDEAHQRQSHLFYAAGLLLASPEFQER